MYRYNRDHTATQEYNNIDESALHIMSEIQKLKLLQMSIHYIVKIAKNYKNPVLLMY